MADAQHSGLHVVLTENMDTCVVKYAFDAMNDVVLADNAGSYAVEYACNVINDNIVPHNSIIKTPFDVYFDFPGSVKGFRGRKLIEIADHTLNDITDWDMRTLYLVEVT